ncbi:hypothetical protein Snoj_06890 [Streptomyces nojiriensis]|uniref:Uncharacterized protein n=1 Tax=Streptomyces nojiriensis TaxID=66374 RepID=A0ABQ3SF53_9ACTN|nr:hypothetical protein GCM10010205_34250 [Streptomyces nojiriensis]GHI66771.1 hypothetical protein Snoj_06890 [Streptomyces nojiriensis]
MPHIKVCYSIDTQPPARRTIGWDDERDRTRSEGRHAQTPPRVFPAIRGAGNPDFPGFPAAMGSLNAHGQTPTTVIDHTGPIVFTGQVFSQKRTRGRGVTREE